MKRFAVIILAAVVLVFAVWLGWFEPRYTVPILMYHRFGYEEGSLFVTPENFRRQMAYLKEKGYKVISLGQLAEGLTKNKKFPHSTVVITVDDGFRDNKTYAYPVLKQYNFPATIFLITNYIGTKKDFLSWEDVRQMSAGGISFGGHCRNEVYLPSIADPERLRYEIYGSKKDIESRAAIHAGFFCYPTGGFTGEIKAMVRQAGYKGACTTNRGLVPYNRDLYELKRIKVTNSDTSKPFGFWWKLSGYYNLFRSPKKGD